LPLPTDPNVLVGFQTNDDAGVYLLDENTALAQTVDFFTPIVDDPFAFGQIAAANSLSDIYAMGGRPFSALSIVGFPEKGNPQILEQIIRGGLDKMKEANCTVIGGHSIRNEDIQFGYAVTGHIHPKRIWRNVGAQAKDVILLTKPLGTGLISTALKRARTTMKNVEAATASMSQLNRNAAEALRELETKTASHCVHAVTDVTGFGLLGHAREMALGEPEKGTPAVTIEIDHRSVPGLPGALEAAIQGMIPGGLNNNLDFLGNCVSFAGGVPEQSRFLLFDPQTSGGLLIAVSPEVADLAFEILEQHQVTSYKVGRVLAKGSASLSVV
jgi:selenide,water dikinase